MRQSRLFVAEEHALTPGPSPASGRGEIDKGLSLAERVHPKYRPVFEKTERERPGGRGAPISCRTGRRKTCWKSRGRGSSSGTAHSPTSGNSPRGIAIRLTCTRAANTDANTATSTATAPGSRTARVGFDRICARTWRRWRLLTFRPRRCICRTAPMRSSHWSKSIATRCSRWRSWPSIEIGSRRSRC